MENNIKKKNNINISDEVEADEKDGNKIKN